MGLYNFKPWFVEAILAGRKCHTIRGPRAHPDKPGKIMHLYTGLRTVRARLLMRAPCVKVEPITIVGHDGKIVAIWVGDVMLSRDESERFARADGFPSLKAMQEFWGGRLPFAGHIYHWDPGMRKRRDVRGR